MSDYLTYQKAGADTGKVESALKQIVKLAESTFDFRETTGKPVIPVGHFSGVINIGSGVSLAIKTDGVGTKVFIAQEMERYDTVGIDCVAMNVNDILCVGAEPISIVDYIAVQNPDPNLLEDLVKGLVAGCKSAEVTLSGGEIAVMPEMIKGARENMGFDLAGMGVGIVPTDEIITGDTINEGDVILGMASSGIHSNGMTLARRVLLDKFDVTDHIDELGRSLGEELLEPTKIYVKAVRGMQKSNLDLKSLAHITGDGFLNLRRVSKDYGFRIDNLPETPPIFGLIQKHGPVSIAEMYQVFNMGIGFCIVLPAEEADSAIQIAEKHDMGCCVIGSTFKDSEKTVVLEEERLRSKGASFVKYSPNNKVTKVHAQ